MGHQKKRLLLLAGTNRKSVTDGNETEDDDSTMKTYASAYSQAVLHTGSSSVPPTTTTPTTSTHHPHQDDTAAAATQTATPTASFDKSIFVVVGKEAIANDPVLQQVSSEVLVRQLNHLEPDPAERALRILFERTLDTVEDIWVILRRLPYEKGWIKKEAPESDDRPVVVLLGSGWGAHALMKGRQCKSSPHCRQSLQSFCFSSHAGRCLGRVRRISQHDRSRPSRQSFD